MLSGSLKPTSLVLGVTASILYTGTYSWPLDASQSPLLSIYEEAKYSQSSSINEWCPLPEPHNLAKDVDGSQVPFTGPDWIKRQVTRLSAAVNVPTENYDDMGDVASDPRWDPFIDMHALLEELFPKTFEQARGERINRFGLLFTIAGSSPELKPVMLTAHQDVVPAGDLSLWTHPPFQAYFDGKNLWGRGADDCKTQLIAILSTVEFLLEIDWKPTRTVILAFGFDEETGGIRGAGTLGEIIETRYGKDGIEMILDEGGLGMTKLGDYEYALPGVAEKGRMNVVLTLTTQPGHSSIPPSNHTAIGIMSEVIVELEAHPYSPVLTQESPFRRLLECQTRYSPESVEPWLERALKEDTPEDIAVRLAESRGLGVRYEMQTSQAVDIIRGGSKSNALPGFVQTTVNYRISPHDSLGKVTETIRKLAEPIAKKHSVSLIDFDEQNPLDVRTAPTTAVLNLTAVNPLRAAPVSPTDLSNPAWRLFAGTIRSVFEASPITKGSRGVIPVGVFMLGNSDTAHYWNLTQNIYRWNPRPLESGGNIHGVDEWINMEAHLESMRFYYTLLRNFCDGPE